MGIYKKATAISELTIAYVGRKLRIAYYYHRIQIKLYMVRWQRKSSKVVFPKTYVLGSVLNFENNKIDQANLLFL